MQFSDNFIIERTSMAACKIKLKAPNCTLRNLFALPRSASHSTASFVTAAIIATVALLPFSLWADDVHWAVDADGNWTAASNWSSNALPQLTDRVIVDRAGTYTITISGPQ